MMSKTFQSLGIAVCSDLQRLSLDRLLREFGPKSGQSLFEFCRGIDHRQLNVEQDRKSVSAEINYGIRFETDKDAQKFLGQLSEEVFFFEDRCKYAKGVQVTFFLNSGASKNVEARQCSREVHPT